MAYALHAFLPPPFDHARGMEKAFFPFLYSEKFAYTA